MPAPRPSLIRQLLLGIAAAGASMLASAQPPDPALKTGRPDVADLVLKNGLVYTMNPSQPWVQAVAVRQGRFSALGTDAELAGRIGPKTRVVDLGGRLVLAGLHDVHAHPLLGAYEELFNCSTPPAGGVAEVLAAVAACAARAAPGDWIVGGPWSSGLLAELKKPENLTALDRASGKLPLVLRDDTYHNRWANSAALRLAGIGPGSVAPAGGTYAMADGKPTGLLLEAPAWSQVEQRIPPRSAARQRRAAQAAAAKFNSFGITTVQDALVDPGVLAGWHAADAEGAGLTLRVIASLGLMEANGKPAAPPERAALDQVRSERLRPDFVKLFLDGVPMAHTAAMLEPYRADHEHGADYRGTPLLTLAELTDTIARYDRQGTPVKIHAVGDGAVRLALDAVAAVRERNGAGGPRHQIAHISFVAPSDMARFARLNVAADVSPMLWFPHAYTPLFEQVVGAERSAHSYPVKSLIDAGALAAAGSDWPAGQQTPDPWLGLEGLVTRRNPDGVTPGVLGADQALTLEEALKLYTINGARAMGLERETGSIEVGKRADMAVLDQNIFRVAPSKIHQTKVLTTYFEGRAVYQARPAE